MKQTTERLSPGRVDTVEERVIDAMHRFAYSVVADYAAPSDRLLEIGFGEGYGSELVDGLVGEYVGVEVDAAVARHANAVYGAPKRSFQVYGGTTLPFDNASFDLAIAFQVLEHVQDPLTFLREAQRVTRGGGPVMIVTPNRNHRVKDGERPWNRYHVREFSPGELRSTMEEVFPAVELFGIAGSPAMNEIERRRVARARRMARIDRLGLRYLLPESFDVRLRTFLRRRGSAGRDLEDHVRDPSDAFSEVAVEHVHRSLVAVDTSLDLLAVGADS